MNTPITPGERAAMRERYAADLPSAWDTSAAAYGRVLRDLGKSARNDVPRLLDALDTAEAEVARLRGPHPCCEHCAEDPIHDVAPGEHELPCTSCEADTLLGRVRRERDDAHAVLRKAASALRLGESRAEAARLTARPAPAWDEEAVAEAVRKDLEAVGILPWTNGGARIVRTVLAVVRRHLPVKPHRDALAAAIRLRHREMGSGVETVTVGDYESADAALDLWPGRSEAEVKAEALREAADWLADMDDGRDAGQHRAGRDIIARLRARADRLAAEGGADRG